MFDAKRKGRGTREWSEVSLNIQVGCPNDCLYCYAAAGAAGRFGYRARGEWSHEVLTKKSRLTSFPKKEGVVMMPTTHDVTPFNVEAFCRVARVVVGAGNHLLVVSKPRREVMRQVMDALEPFRDLVHLRFTIGALDERLVSFWEPGASSPQERIHTLRDAVLRGFHSSVSIEPMLGGVDETLRVLSVVAGLGAETVWIGKMNRICDRVRSVSPEDQEQVALVQRLQRDEWILALYDVASAGFPQVRWKESITEVLVRHGRLEAGDGVE